MSAATSAEFGPQWWDLAACRETDPEVFFPDPGVNANRAKSICRRCPVRDACLEDALDSGDIYHGVRGGLSARELQDEARRRRAKSAPVALLRRNPREDEVDRSVVQRFVDHGGERPSHRRLTHAEGLAAYRILRDRGVTGWTMEHMYHLRPERYKAEAAALDEAERTKR